MASTEDILKKAGELGKLIADHATAKKLGEAVEALQGDVDAQRILTDYNRQVQAIGEKQSQGKPVEVDDKHKLDQLQQQVIRNPTLRNFQMAQMDHIDLMRKVDEAMAGQQQAEAPAATPPAASPIINPDIADAGQA